MERAGDAAAALERALGVRFRDGALLAEALTHPSRRRECGGDAARDNQRLEFLGDAVLHLMLADRVYRAAPDADEGAMTEARRALERGGALAAKARALGLADALSLGKAEAAAGMADADKTLEDAFEALFGALWLDQGAEACAALTDRIFAAEISAPAPAGGDPKSALQMLAQKRFKAEPVYAAGRECGAAHKRVFHFTAAIPGCCAVGAGAGKTKKEAQAAAAADLLRRLP